MPLEIIRNDITKVKADAIVNAANSSLLGGGGVDGAIHLSAGAELMEECRGLGGCRVGQAKITKGYNLPAKYVIHTVGPIWQGGNNNEEQLLIDCYQNSLELAREYQLETVAFPLISAGAYGYPKDKALRTAISVIGDFLLENDMTIFIVVYDKNAVMLSEKLFKSIKEYIDDNYIDEQPKYRRNIYEEAQMHLMEDLYTPIKKKGKRSLDDIINNMDETFTEMLLRLIHEKSMKESEAYKKANVDRKHFSKIRNDVNYNPKKTTALAFAIALKLNLDETKDLLLKAGYALSRSNKFDVIIEYFIESKNYDIFEINEALFAFHQKTLGE